MAECAVSFVLDKLTTLLEEKVNLIKDVKQEVEYVRDELERMTAFLRVADATEDSDPELKVWVKQVRNLAYETEDVIDEFMLQIYPNGFCSFGVCGLLNKLIRKLKTHCEIASEIQIIKSRMSDIAVGHRRYCYKFDVSNQRLSLTSGSSHGGGIDRRGDALLLEEGELVGIDAPKKELVSWLVQGDTRLKVVAVLGMGGLGKTTLVKKVFDDGNVIKHFHNHAWITVSQTFKVEELLKDTIQQLFDQMKIPLPQDLRSMNGSRLKATIKEFLRHKRYVLVFDDVWSVQAWEAIKYALPNEGQGSRIVLTTRVMDVASTCIVENNGYIFRLNPLSEEESSTLFFRKAFQGNPCPAHLTKICKKILKRCRGLPLAIVAISGVLSTKKDAKIDEWKMLDNSLGTELESNNQLESIKSILLLSFNDLPYYLKPCFMYLSSYPEDYSIQHNTLMRQWIAEGLIKRKEGRAMEEVAQGYLNELVNRSLIHPLRMNDDGSVKESCIHDFYREIILSKSRDQNFMTSTDEQNVVRVRRLAVHGPFAAADVTRYGAKLCSLVLFGVQDSQSVSSILKLLKRCKMLKVLDLRGVPLEKFPESILQLYHLKYLSMRETRIRKIPQSIGKLQKLEILDLKGTYVKQLPEGILKLQYLRQLLVYHHVSGSYLAYNFVNGFKALKGIGKLKFLQKLCIIEAHPGSGLLEEISSLTELTRISITRLRNEDSAVLCSSIQNLRKLSSLALRVVEGDVLDLSYLSSPPPFLQRMYLDGRLAKFPHWIKSLTYLVKVYFRWSQLRVDPLEHLQDLPSLVHLEFLDGYVGESLSFEAGKFQKLKLLGLDRLQNLKSVIIKQGSMPLLEKLIIQQCNLLESVPVGIEHLSVMKDLEFFDMPMEFISSLSQEKCGDEYWKITHIPQVYHTYWRNNCWEVYTLEGQQPPKGQSGTTEAAAVFTTHEQRNWM